MVKSAPTQYVLRKEKLNMALYLIGGIGLFVVGVLLLVRFGPKRDTGGIVLGLVSFFWSVMLLNQYRKSRELVADIQARLDEAAALSGVGGTAPDEDENEGEGDAGEGEPATPAEQEDEDGDDNATSGGDGGDSREP